MRPTRHGPGLEGTTTAPREKALPGSTFSTSAAGRRCSGSFLPLHPPPVPPRPRALSGTGPLPGSPRSTYLAGAAGSYAPLWPGRVQSFPAGLPVPPPRCNLDLAPVDPQGRGREQTRVGGAGAEAEGRAQREEAAEPRSPGRPLPLSIPASGRRSGRGRRSPASGGRVLQGPGECGRRARSRRRGPGTLWGCLLTLSECRSWTRAGRAGGKKVGPWPKRTASWRVVCGALKAEAGGTSLQVLMST